MKTLGTYVAIVALAFALGLGIVAANPGTARAGPGPGGCVEYACSRLICAGHDQCESPYVDWVLYWFDDIGCSGFPCDYEFIGCGHVC